jgi:hypothetical protein
MLAHTTLAERGFEAVVRAGHLETADGRTFGLDNLASKFRQAPGSDWPQVVAGHLDALLGHYPQEPGELTVEVMRAGVHARLATYGAAEQLGWCRCARPLGPDLLGILAHKDGDFVRWLNDDDVTRCGGSGPS